MKTPTLLRVATPLLGLGLVLSACGGSGSSTASGGNASSTTAAGGASTTAGNGSGGGSGSGSGAASGGTLCTVVSADQMTELLGQQVTEAKDISADGRFRSSSTLPACKYLGAPVAGSEFMLVAAEQISCGESAGFFDDPVAKRKALAGVGDKAAYRPDAVDPTLVIDTFSQKGDQCMLVRIFKGTDEATATKVTNALWGA